MQKISINRYTPEAQQILGASTKPAPWLHIMTIVRDGGAGTVEDKPVCYYVIFVWDTREVVESKKLTDIDVNAYHPFSSVYKPSRGGLPKIPAAHDSHEQLKGSGGAVQLCNHYIKFQPK